MVQRRGISAGRRAAGWLAALLLALVGITPLLPAAPASAATLYGHDISWPQCPAPGGFGLPMPPASSQFVIVGLTRGLAFTENPCLADQVAWVRANSKPAHAYAMATFPTASQLSTYRNAGPWHGTTRAAQLSNVGYAEATAAVASLRKVTWRPPVVWIDVEPRPAQPWPSATAQQRLENRYVVEGLMRGLREAGFSYGLYSYATGWQEITGGWRLPAVPVWATAGRLDYPTEAADRCTQPSFSGGRVHLSQWYDDTRDYDRTCGTYAFTPLPVPPASMTGSSSDLDGDWRNDVLARSGDGGLWLYRGNGTGGWLPRQQIGNGWNGMDVIDTAGDFSGDGRPDVLAREQATGYLWLYRGNGTGGWLPRVRVGTGWNGMSAIFSPGDLDGDARVDVLARVRSTGELWLYRGNGTGGWLPRVRVGTGWNGMSALLGPGDLTGDGAADVLAREAGTGRLVLYPGDGRGGWRPRITYGPGWNAMSALVGPGDFTGDRVPDLLAREAATGYLWLYPGNGAGGWQARVRVGVGWQSMTALA
ncbi:VCBS repeat-containing protein [Georgenia sp. EYE_87]|uniref:FG-GAP-like repeat-containing protein n=1 Tax=Georgenia sp. EYE_87 TaxID=2853448 RepID=UPI00200502F9|nr:FG-GAP-like repeat-containing protein [Georgenia sp. EYE_87]MCK6211792.1 VCBS repeat-containing protein [Georgenia sp. EYE_87]